MIRSSKHYIEELNSGKRLKLKEYIQECRRVAGIIVKDIWENGYDGYHPVKNKFNCPKFIKYKTFKVKTTLSARAVSTLVVQITGMLKNCTEQQRRRLYQYSITPTKSLLAAIQNFRVSAPDTSRLNPEISTNCCDFISSDKFNILGHLRLKAIGESFGHIIIPIKRHKHSEKFKDYTMMTSFQICTNRIEVRWKKLIPIQKTGEILGIDSGQATVVTCSDGQITVKDIHGHNLKSICDTLARKKNKSKAFRRAQEHRTNHINWAVKQISLKGIKEVRFEDNKNLRSGRIVSRSLKHYTYSEIKQQIENMCELNGVRFVIHDSPYFSQRCCKCGWVQKKNRRGRLFTCSSCGHEADADLNAAVNHVQDLPSARSFIKSGRNKKGFFWISSGFYSRSGQEIGVPDSL